MKWLQGEIPSAITDMQEQIEQLHIMLERQIHSKTDLEEQSSQRYDISDKEGHDDGEGEAKEEATEITKEKRVHFPGVFGSKDFVAQDSIAESNAPEKQESFFGR